MNMTLNSYVEFLRKAQKSFDFNLIKNFENARNNTSIFLRHDIDLSLERAEAMASAEAKLGIMSTYFVNLHADTYNPLEIEQLELMKSILLMGHDIGIHYDTKFYAAANRNCLANNLEEEKRIFQYALNHEVAAFSFHNPSSQELKIKDLKVASLVNCYSSVIRSELQYISDSNGIWRFETPEVIFNNSNQSYQILLHPGWWLEIDAEPIKKVCYLALRRAFRRIRVYEDKLENFGRLNGSRSYEWTRGERSELEKKIQILTDVDALKLLNEDEF